MGQHQAQSRPAQSCSCRTCDESPPWPSFGRALVCWRRTRRTRATRDGGPKGEHAEEAHPIAREATDHVVFDDSSADLEEPHTTSVLDLSAAIYKHIRSNGVTKVDIGRLWALVATVSDTNAIRVQPKSAHVLHPKALDRVVLVVPARPTSNQYITNVPECREKHHHFFLDREVRSGTLPSRFPRCRQRAACNPCENTTTTDERTNIGYSSDRPAAQKNPYVRRAVQVLPNGDPSRIFHVNHGMARGPRNGVRLVGCVGTSVHSAVLACCTATTVRTRTAAFAFVGV